MLAEPQEVLSNNPGPIEPPQEVPPSTPGVPTEPPREDPIGNPTPDILPPMREPGEAPQPQELPGNSPDELPVRGPPGPGAPSPATDGGIDEPPGSSDVVPGTPETPSSM
jgi:hypothetical protein